MLCQKFDGIKHKLAKRDFTKAERNAISRKQSKKEGLSFKIPV